MTHLCIVCYKDSSKRNKAKNATKCFEDFYDNFKHPSYGDSIITSSNDLQLVKSHFFANQSGITANYGIHTIIAGFFRKCTGKFRGQTYSEALEIKSKIKFKHYIYMLHFLPDQLDYLTNF